MQGMLKWNPNDNQGIRFLITSEYLRAGEATRASRILKKEGDHFPPYQYEAALIEIAAGRMVQAATTLRRAFIAAGNRRDPLRDDRPIAAGDLAWLEPGGAGGCAILSEH